ncbi:AraC family transcriptional regulator [Paenibacillus sp. TRM 82003]|nr:AraC family transcriptional regulator [Paenibacillus sp. TRM 82003]
MMPLQAFRKNGTLYIKLLIGITFCIAITLIVSSAIYYVSYARILQKEAFESDLYSLTQTSEAVAGTTESAQALSFQIYRNSAIAKLLYYPTPSPFDVRGAMMDLNNYLATMPFIESIYVYQSSADTFHVVSRNGRMGALSREELHDRNILDVLEHYDEYKPFTPIPRLLRHEEDDAETHGIYTYLCYETINFDQNITSAVIVNISASWVNREIEKEKGNTYILDDRNQVVSGRDMQQQAWNSQDAALIASAVKEGRQGYLIAQFQGEKSLITYSAPDRFQWRYVRITPYEQLMKQVIAVRAMTLRIAVVVLATGLLLSWVLSKILYVPIQRIVTRVRDLESEKRDSSYTLRQNALRKLLQLQSFHPDNQLEKLRRLGIPFDFTAPYRLALIRIDEYRDLRERNGDDLLTYKFAAMNIATEIASKRCTVEAVDLDGDRVLLLLNAALADKLSFAALAPMFQEIQAAGTEYLRLGLSIAVTSISTDPSRLRSLYKEALEAAGHRFFAGRASILDIEALELEPAYGYAFPAAKERRLVDALVAGKTEEAKELFRCIMKDTARYPIQVAELASSHIAMSLANMAAEMQRNGSMALGLGAELRVPDLSAYETLEELTAAYDALFDELKSRIVEKRSGKHEELIRKINAMIEDRYADPSLSLNWIADKLNMSTFHISRVYRQQTLTAIVDVINHVRMEKAKSLLLQSGESIATIAEQTGYTNSSYFHRMFKKAFGVTPAEFRKANA